MKLTITKKITLCLSAIFLSLSACTTTSTTTNNPSTEEMVNEDACTHEHMNYDCRKKQELDIKLGKEDGMGLKQWHNEKREPIE